jgi:glycine dehydrogenase
MAGLKVVAIKVHPDGNLDLEDLRTKAEKHKANLAAFMVATHPLSTSPINRNLRSRIRPPSAFLSLVFKM